MNQAERLRIFRPGHVSRRLHWQESQLIGALMALTHRQLEHLRIQVQNRTRPANLILSTSTVRDMADTLAKSMMDTAGMSSLAIYHEIVEARATRYGDKPHVFKAAVRRLEPGDDWAEFQPWRGLDWYRDYALRIVGVEQQAALDAGRQAIIDGINEGEGIDDQAARLGEAFTQLSQGRLERIARTETMKVYNQGRLQGMQDEAEIVGYEWSAILDTRTCESCLARNHRRVPKADVEGFSPPIHPGDRCVLLGIFSWEIESGDVTWNPVPADAPAVADGWGTTHMRILPVEDRAAKRLVRRIAA